MEGNPPLSMAKNDSASFGNSSPFSQCSTNQIAATSKLTTNESRDHVRTSSQKLTTNESRDPVQASCQNEPTHNRTACYVSSPIRELADGSIANQNTEIPADTLESLDIYRDDAVGRDEKRCSGLDPNKSILMHFTPTTKRKVKSIEYTQQDTWFPAVKEFLVENRMTRPSHIQSGMWPVLNRLYSAVAVAGPRQGKTLGWLMPLASALADKEHYIELPPGGGARSIVLVNGYKAAEEMLKTIEILIQRNVKLKAVALYAGLKDADITCSLLDCPDILITTPTYLLEILKILSKEHWFNLKRCCHLVIEDASDLMTSYPKELNRIMNIWNDPDKYRDADI